MSDSPYFPMIPHKSPTNASEISSQSFDFHRRSFHRPKYHKKATGAQTDRKESEEQLAYIPIFENKLKTSRIKDLNIKIENQEKSHSAPSSVKKKNTTVFKLQNDYFFVEPLQKYEKDLVDSLLYFNKVKSPIPKESIYFQFKYVKQEQGIADFLQKMSHHMHRGPLQDSDKQNNSSDEIKDNEDMSKMSASRRSKILMKSFLNLVQKKHDRNDYSTAEEKLNSEVQNFKDILGKLSMDFKILNLAKNFLNHTICSKIVRVLLELPLILSELNLQQTNLNEHGATTIMTALISKDPTKKVNLSNNNLSEKTSYSLNSYIKKSNNLLVFNQNINQYKELYLHKNNFNSVAGKYIFEALKENKQIRVLDLSFNPLGLVSGLDQSRSCVFLLHDILSGSRTELTHLDLSNCRFSYEESQLISQGLTQNRWLIGFHFLGNHGQIDPEGFLVLDPSKEKSFRQQSEFLLTQDQYVQVDSLHMINSTMKTNCWICEGWTDVLFEWTKKSGKRISPLIFLHLDFDNYRPHLLQRKKLGQNESFTLTYMCPPLRKISYFFTVDGKATIALDQPMTKHKLSDVLTIKMSDRTIKIQVPRINVMFLKPNQNLFDQNSQYQLNEYPRLGTKKSEQTYLDTAEHFKFSIFQVYNERNDEEYQILGTCFESDWSKARIWKVMEIEDEVQEIKEIVRQGYKKIVEVYKYYSSFSIYGDNWCISQKTYRQFLYHSDLLDTKFLKLTDAMQLFDATNYSSPRANIGAILDKGVLRFEFIQLLARLAEQKYIRDNTFKSYKEAINHLIQIKLSQALESISAFHNIQNWREIRFKTSQIDLLVSFYDPLIQVCFHHFASTMFNQKSQQEKLISLHNFRKMVLELNLVGFGEKESNIVFNQSVGLQVEENDNPRLMHLNYVEFLESLGRISEKISLPPIHEQEKDWPLEKRKNFDLHLKFESLMNLLYEKCTHRSFKDQFKMPTESFFIDEILPQSLRQQKKLSRIKI